MPVAVRNRIASPVSVAGAVSATCSVEAASKSGDPTRSKAPAAHEQAASVGASTKRSRASEVATAVSSTETSAAKGATAVEATSTTAMKAAATAVTSASLRKRGIGR